MSYPPPYERTTWHGKVVDNRSKYILELVEDRLGFDLYCYQGSYNPGGIAQSAGTHDGGGAIDVSIRPLNGSTTKADLIVRTLRDFGWAAWHRTPDQGDWSDHIHAIEIGNKHLSSGARHQIDEYKAGRNGLASGGLDDGPRIILKARAYPLPYVSLENVRKQAQTGGPRVVRGVRRVQRALNAKIGADLPVDGRFGPKTKRAYARWEERIGGDGDGIPGLFSLLQLGTDRFKVRKQ